MRHAVKYGLPGLDMACKRFFIREGVGQYEGGCIICRLINVRDIKANKKSLSEEHRGLVEVQTLSPLGKSWARSCGRGERSVRSVSSVGIA